VRDVVLVELGDCGSEGGTTGGTNTMGGGRMGDGVEGERERGEEGERMIPPRREV
jgi:hypothetical protein